ncbi:MAG: hypothetical protein JWM93_106 [Frankiales bacterium]|nr:hypothetical protein [Frankiales bacterium]
MAGMGPPPKPAEARARRNATFSTTRLPAKGRTGTVPGWPLVADVVMTAKRDIAQRKLDDVESEMQDAEGAKRGTLERKFDRLLEQVTILDRQLEAQRDLEARLWAEMWWTPQAAAWERLLWHRDVAQYVRHKVLGELGMLNDAKEARQWSDRLGLNPQAMLRLRWEIATDELGEQREARTGTSSRERFGGLTSVSGNKPASAAPARKPRTSAK